MRSKNKNIILLLTFLAGTYMNAQQKTEKKHVKWRTYFEPSKTNLNEGCLVFEAQVDSGWQMFAQNQLPQLPVGIEIMIKPTGNFTAMGMLTGPLPEIAFSHTYNKPVAVYKGKVQFRQKILLKSKEEFNVNAVVDNEEISKAEEIFYYKNDVVVNVKPPKGIRLKFL